MESFIIIIFGALTFIAATTNVLPNHINFKHKTLLFCVTLSAFLLFFNLLGQNVTFISLFFILVYVFLTQEKKILYSICSMAGYIIEVVLNYILLILSDTVLGINYQKLVSDYLIPFCLFFYALVYITTYLLGQWLRKKLMLHPLDINNNKLILILLNLFACVIMFIANISFAERLGYHFEMLVFNAFLFFIYFVLSSFLLSFSINSIRKEEEAKRQLAEYKNLENYTKNLEELYMQTRSFKHDYINILSTMTCYIQEKDYDGLDSYFQNHILPTQQNFNESKYSIALLGNLKLLELKSLFYVKLIQAFTASLTVQIDIPFPIEEIDMNIIDLARILGIFWDNAIEAAKETDEKHIYIGILQDNSTIISMQNSSTDSDLQMNRLYQPGYTEKGEGHGIGLANVDTILQKYEYVFLTTTYQENVFRQVLKIECAK